MNSVQEVPFRVSARTARLIGRENVATAESAISELVKNSYDADASFCIVRISPAYDHVPAQLPKREYDLLTDWGLAPENHYDLNDDFATLRPCLGDKHSPEAKLIQNFVTVTVTDDGSGMGDDAIRDAWMVIGTANKEQDSSSKMGRTRTGAKGIGRFALDRLGAKCQLHSSSTDENDRTETLTWTVDWNKFEKDGAVLDEVTATIELGAPGFSNAIESIRKVPSLESFAKSAEDKRSGTSIHISEVRDHWSPETIKKLRRTLGVLAPPDEQRAFNIYLHDDRDPDQSNSVTSDVLEDFDYKLTAKVLEHGDVQFTVVRNELNHDEFPEAFFKRKDMKKEPFTKESFDSRTAVYVKSLQELFPGESELFHSRAQSIGTFDVVLRFFKLQMPSKADDRQYPYRSFQPQRRREWLDIFGGIRIYRDNFGVRPYGEPKSGAYDWLSLGQRRAANPAAPTRLNWPVPPQNIAGTVNISRNENSVLVDQSNREGIIETEEFRVFQALILRFVNELEKDRSRVLFNLLETFKVANADKQVRTEGLKLAQKIREKPQDSTEDVRKLAQTVKVQEDLLKEQAEDQVILRSLATLGTVMVSFAHEMGQLNTLAGRNQQLAALLARNLDEKDFAGKNEAFNPFAILRDMEASDKKAAQWFNFALSAVQSGRRRRTNVDMRSHLNALKVVWDGFLEPREIDLDLNIEEGFTAEILAFEIDIDSIFNNLILNSFEAFVDGMGGEKRNIRIDIFAKSAKEVGIIYEDNGPGIHSSIKDPSEIFEFNVTTKKDREGKGTGTGLGMWILESVVRSYDGTVRAYRKTEDYGFRLEFSLPVAKVNGI
jgi:signal transduction histidine kinase